MPRKKPTSSRVNLTPRRETSLNTKQELFAMHYAATLDANEALVKAGYRLATDDAKRDAKSRLLRHPAVRVIVDEAHAKAVAKYELGAEGIVLRLRMIYLESMRSGDWSAAVNALREIGKLGGYYEKHQRQKAYTQADVERLKTELEAAGFDFTRIALVNPSPN